MSHNKTPSVISNARKHLSYFFVSNSNPSSFVLRVTKTEEKNASTEPPTWFRSIAVLPYVKGLSEQLCRFLQHQDISAVFNSETTLRSHLIRPKDAVDPAKQDGVLYRIPCGKVNIGETGRSMQERIKEQDWDIRPATTRIPTISEHAHNTSRAK